MATPKILIIYTGGTIGMGKDPVTGVLEPLDFNHLVSSMPEFKLIQAEIDVRKFDPPIDSSDMDPMRWAEIVSMIANNYNDYDGFVILHGTDTMAYTSSALSFMLENLTKPVILTGSQLPIGELRTDGKENLMTAIEIASAKDENGRPMVPEVCIFFNGKLIRGNRAIKINAEGFHAFESFNYPQDAATQVLISTIDYNEYVGRIGVGKVDNGTIRVNQDVVICNHHNPDKIIKTKVSKLYEFDGLNKVEVKEAGIGSIVAVSGISELHIGDTICSPENVVPIPFQKISEPTIAMQFMVNDSPLAGQEGKFVTSRHLRDRLFRELNTDVSLRVEETDSPDRFKVSGRGELHLSVLIENMRREGFEFAVSKAEVLYHTDENGKKLEPMELAYIDVPNEFAGAVIEKLGQRKGELRNMGSISGGTYTRLEFSIPARGLIGYRGEFMTDTKGNGILNTVFDDYGPYKGDIQYRKMGSLIAFEAGEAITYGLYNAQERGTLFIGPGEKVYSGMVIGQTGRNEDIEINVCKKKQLTNTRSSSADEALRLTPPRVLSLEQALDFIDTDELLEVTPTNLRIRKKILDPTLRKRAMINRNA